MTYGYHSPIPPIDYKNSDGTVAKENDTDYRTVARYKEYLNAGLNTLLLQANDGYYGNYATSDLKTTFANAKAAGIKRVIVCDNLFFEKASSATVSIIGECTNENLSVFQSIYGYSVQVGDNLTYDDLVTVFKNRLKDYIHEENFYGVILNDEPTFLDLAQTAMTYKALKEAFPLAKAELEDENVTVTATDIYIQVCMWAYGGPAVTIYNQNFKYSGALTDGAAIYREYITTYLDLSGATEIIFDSYPMLDRTLGGGTAEYNKTVQTFHFEGLRILSEIANEYCNDDTKQNVVIGGVAASTECTSTLVKAPDEEDMYYQINSYAMFGLDSIGYYTYWAKTSSAEVHTDGTAFIDRNGNKTELYTTMQGIHTELQGLSELLLSYDYSAVKKYGNNSPYWMSYFNSSSTSFAILDSGSVSQSNGSAIVTELINKQDTSEYMYAVMNANAPANDISGITAGGDITVTLDFSEYSSAQVYLLGSNGSAQSVSLVSGAGQSFNLSNGILTLTLSAGSTAYVVPVM